LQGKQRTVLRINAHLDFYFRVMKKNQIKGSM